MIALILRSFLNSTNWATRESDSVMAPSRGRTPIFSLNDNASEEPATEKKRVMTRPRKRPTAARMTMTVSMGCPFPDIQ